MKLKAMTVATISFLLISAIALHSDSRTYRKERDELNVENKKLKDDIKKANSEIEESQNKINEADKVNGELVSKNESLEVELEKIIKERDSLKVSSRGGVRQGESGEEKNLGSFTISAYDLSIQSCGRKRSSRSFGKTASGYSLVGLSREQAMTIATDPKVIPLGSRVKIEFSDINFKHLNGVYISRDTGSAIKNRKIDLFYGDFGSEKTHQSVWDFGLKDAKVTILN